MNKMVTLDFIGMVVLGIVVGMWTAIGLEKSLALGTYLGVVYGILMYFGAWMLDHGLGMFLGDNDHDEEAVYEERVYGLVPVEESWSPTDLIIRFILANAAVMGVIAAVLVLAILFPIPIYYWMKYGKKAPVATA